ncbi:MAG: PD40 domain-containing protein [Acidobacteria bacterium]|nr:PD40 domain-containing protein [Acidobacteriota bacterium]MBI3487990.1 PD40 domain-containing protein [Acidobacteriota bacterium]
MPRFFIRTFLLALAASWLVPGLRAQQTEVVLSATSSAKLVLGMTSPKISGLDAATVASDFTAVLRKDLDETGVIAVLAERLPADGAPAKAWKEAGAQWLLNAKLTKAANGDLQMEASAVDTSAEKGVFTRTYNANKIVPLRYLAHYLADDLVGRLTGEKGVASSRILFVRQVSPGVKEIFQVDRDGAGLVQLTRHGSLTLAPSLASDGRLAYITYKGGAPEIWGQRRKDGPHEKFYPTTAAGGMLSSPVWSPDGKRLAFVQGDRRGNSDIMVLDVASGRARRLTDGTGINTEPSWNPNGNQIAFTSDREGGPQVFLMQDDGSNLRRLTAEGLYNASPAWSPNGAMIAYVSRFEGKFDLFVYKLGEGKAYQITTGVSTSESPAWSPDERLLVFTSNRFGPLQLFTTDLSGRQIRRLTELPGCQSPRWIRGR